MNDKTKLQVYEDFITAVIHCLVCEKMPLNEVRDLLKKATLISKESTLEPDEIWDLCSNLVKDKLEYKISVCAMRNK